MKLFGHIIKGKLRITNRAELESWAENMPDCDVVGEIEKRKVKRTIPQNAYLHACFTILTKEFNRFGNTFTVEQMKDIVKAKLLAVSVHNTDGQYMGDRVKHTSELSKEEMGEFIEGMKAWAAEFDIVLPDPEQQTQFIYTHDKETD